MKTSIYIIGSMDSNSDLDSLVDKKTSRIMFKIKKYYIIYIQNGRSIDFDILKTVAKNTLAYKVFNKENWEQKTKKCGYRYLNQILENWREKIQRE